jgi:hypothetical protein
LRLFLAVFEMSNGIATHICELSQLADAKAAALAHLAQTTQLHVDPPH